MYLYFNFSVGSLSEMANSAVKSCGKITLCEMKVG